MDKGKARIARAAVQPPIHLGRGKIIVLHTKHHCLEIARAKAKAGDGGHILVGEQSR